MVVKAHCASKATFIMASFDATWDFAGLSNAVCDTLVEQGKIRTKPAFIRVDRQEKIAKVRRSKTLTLPCLPVTVQPSVRDTGPCGGAAAAWRVVPPPLPPLHVVLGQRRC